MARAGSKRLSALEAWQRANRDALTAACAGQVKPAAVAAVLRILTSRADDCGRVDESIKQLADSTLLSEAQVKRALDVLQNLGVLINLRAARSGGRGGGKGRAPLRLLSFLQAAETDTGDGDGLGITQNGGAVIQEWQRSNRGMAAQLTARPHGITSTDNPLSDADAELAAGTVEGGTDTHKGREINRRDSWQSQVCDAAARSIYETDELAGRTKTVRDPDAVKRTKARAVLPHLIELQGSYARLPEIARGSSDWYELVTVLACLTTGEAPSEQAWEALSPYRLALAAGGG
jgi:hypothetical protein